MADKPRYANALGKGIAAAINGLYRFQREQSAYDKLARLTEEYITAKTEQAEDDKSVTIWLRNFELTPEKEEAGYLGNFAKLDVTRMDDEDGHYSITAELIDIPLNKHPLRKRAVSRAPNWGHPILRKILAAKPYLTLEEAEADLAALHLEYPETTIPATNKLYLMIFSRRETPEKPLQKHVLEIVNQQGGGFLITHAKNEYKKTDRPKVAPPIASVDGETEERMKPTGHFTSMVALKSRKRKPNA